MIKQSLVLTGIILAGLAAAPQVEAASGVWAKSASNTQITVGWSSRGGSCQIKYSEANETSYKYQTVASCDQAMLTIGYLNGSTKYKFSVSQDGGTWSAPVYASPVWQKPAVTVSATATSSTAVSGPVAPATRETVAESIGRDDFQPKYMTGCNTQGSMRTAGSLNDDERKTGKCGTGITNIRTVSGHTRGEVTVYWSDNTASHGDYHLMYGTESGYYTMGALNVGGASNSFTVKGLTPGVRYYFKLVPLKDGRPVGGSSWEVSDVAR